MWRRLPCLPSKARQSLVSLRTPVKSFGNNIVDSTTVFCYIPLMAIDPELNQVLVAILRMLRDQAEYMHRQHGWMIALADTLTEDAEIEKRLRQHPFHDQGPRLDEQITRGMIQNIEALIQQL